MVLGHEITGEVIEKGRDVEYLEIGDLVSVPFNVACGRRPCHFHDSRRLRSDERFVAVQIPTEVGADWNNVHQLRRRDLTGTNHG
jgi:threonine dehydrogenase-like Zn-dependent dehydrogenase